MDSTRLAATRRFGVVLAMLFPFSFVACGPRLKQQGASDRGRHLLLTVEAQSRNATTIITMTIVMGAFPSRRFTLAGAVPSNC